MRTRRRSRLGRAGWSVIVFAVAIGLLPQSSGAFFGTTTNSGTSFTAAATFPTYPASVVADSPLFYYRMDDAAGSVTATDSSGNSNPGVYGTSQNAAFTGLWPMDDGSGATAKDRSAVAAPKDLTLTNATWTASGRSGSALVFNGTTAYAATASSVLTTSGSFSVQAWVYLSSSAATGTAVSQDGSNVSGFELGYDQSANRWAFSMRRSDSAAAVIDKLNSAAVPATSTWTHLAGVYDSSNGSMRIYVNGTSDATMTFGGTAWNATGALQVGAGMTTSRNNFWNGRVDDVRVHSGTVVTVLPREVTLGPTGGPSTYWQFDENTGTTAGDKSGSFNTGTVGSAATWAGGKYSTSIDLPNDTSGNGYVAGAAAGVDTSVSFTVSAWVYLDHTTLGAASRVALSQSSSVMSGFILRYNHYSGKWDFSLTQGPTDNYSPTFDTSGSSGSAALTTWTHLVGVHDAGAQTATLYVNGVAQTPVSHTAVFNATGPLQVGRVKEFGAWQVGTAGQEYWAPWAGRIDDVRVFRRALGQQEVSALYSSTAGVNATGTSLGVPGALQGAQQGQTSSTAQAYSSSARNSYNPTSYNNPTTYSQECWFRATAYVSNGRTLIGFGPAAVGNSSSGRRLFLDSTGRLVAGTNSGTSGMAQTSGTYIDEAWHHAVVTVSPGTGIKLYVDGNLAASAAYAAPSNITGYWRVGGDTWSVTWPADYLWYAQIDEVAVYNTVLTAQQVARHYRSNH